MQGRSVDEYRAPLFIAWQLTNRCQARCIACCEESGPDRAWRDELTRDEALRLARSFCDLGVPYVAFGGGEPLGVPFCWDLFEVFAAAGVRLKIETDGRHIDDAAADRLAALDVQCVQVSVDGASAQTHARVRPGGDFAGAIGAIQRLAHRGLAPQLVFVPTRFNIDEIVAAYEMAAELGCGAFVTGPLMRIGRAASAWDEIACSEEQWDRAVDALRRRAESLASATALSIYPWDIAVEMERRLDDPQAMLLVVPNGKVKLLNALPFAVADLRRDDVASAWDAYRRAWRAPEVRAFVSRCRADPGLLRHANETWPVGEGAGAAATAAIGETAPVSLTVRRENRYN
jgi:MoaA/NifB/PqqE/SkfB family radical SAM enzyme